MRAPFRPNQKFSVNTLSMRHRSVDTTIDYNINAFRTKIKRVQKFPFPSQEQMRRIGLVKAII